MTRRVAVTGLGLVTPVGNDVASTWSALVAGQSGAGPITRFDSARLPVHFACEVKRFDPSPYMDRKEVRRYDLFSQFAVAAAAQAVRDACLEQKGKGELDPKRVGVIIGTGTGGIA
ncbi:MAG: beta-ketoacyl synthase N-terminal-like domain-containing protein, partial [Gemmatimonadales bacterium]